MNNKFIWLNIFIRDFLLIGTVTLGHYLTSFSNNVLWLLTGMLAVFVSWHFDDYTKQRRMEKWGQEMSQSQSLLSSYSP